MSRAAVATGCAHCGLPAAGARFCCSGCELAYELIHQGGLERFYELRSSTGSPVLERESAAPWLEARAAELASGDGVCRLLAGVEGIHCAACVWLIERSFRRHPGAARVVVNPARGAVELFVEPDFPLLAWAAELESFGYRLTPRAAAAAPAIGLLVRFGVSAAIALNAMMIAAALYLGLEGGRLHQLFVWLSAALAAASLAVGGNVFFARAWRAVRGGAASFDVPVALGIALVFAASLWSAASGRGGALYFDSLSLFVALMLGGRLLQERVIAANRRRIAAADGDVGVQARRLERGATRAVAAADLEVGDVIVVAPRELVPVDASLLDDRAGCRLDWISGESEPRLWARGEVIPAGAFNASRHTFRARVVRSFADSGLAALVAAADDPGDTATVTGGSGRVATLYLAAVLVAAAAGIAGWLMATRNVARALEVGAAVLVVTCPCALGIGAPLAFELVASRLRTRGVFVRRGRALERLAAVRHVAFDKTGTLTEGRLALAESPGLAQLSATERSVLFNLAARSSHPKSAAVAETLGGEALWGELDTREIAGLGIEARRDGVLYRLGEPQWAGADPGAAAGAAVFSADRRPLATLRFGEVLRNDAAAEAAALRDAGYRLSLVSGDDAAKVDAVAAALAVASEDAVAGASPEDKAAWIAAADAGDLLFVGDGLNDALALERATASATPSIDRPLIASRADFYFTSPGLAPVRVALGAARALASIVRAQLGFVFLYNTLAIALALSGLMRPWLAAVLMPASSVAVVAATALAVKRSAAWRS